MDSLARDILRHLEGGPGSVRPLLSSHPRSSLYRRLGELLQEGLVERDRSEYRLLPAGRSVIERGVSAGDTGRMSGLAALEAHLPALALAPTRAHRAVLGLVCCAMVARKHRMRASHHPGFVLFGPAMRWKSWTARAACLMAGIDPERFVVQLATESGRSLLVRKGAKGERRSARAALEQPVVGLDEFLRATPEVRRMVQALLCGELTIPDENDLLELRAVPLILMNPRDGEQLSERVGLDAAMLRRSIAVDLGRVEIPAEIVAEGDARLAKLAALPQVALRAPRCPEWDPQEQVRRRLLLVLADRALLAGVDLSMLSMLSAAATAWLSPAVALEAVLEAFLSAIETLGWLHRDWQRRLDEERLERGLEGAGAGEAPRPPEPDLDYLEQLERVSAVCARLGVSPEVVARRAHSLERLQERGVEHEDFARVVRLLDGGDPDASTTTRLEQLEHCASLGRAEEELRGRVERLEEQAVAAARELEDTRVQLHEAVRSARAELYPGPSPATVALGRALQLDESDAQVVGGYLLQELAELLGNDGAGADLGAALAALASRARERVRLEDELGDLRARVAGARRECRALDMELARRHEELRGLRRARPVGPWGHPFGGPFSGPRSGCST